MKAAATAVALQQGSGQHSHARSAVNALTPTLLSHAHGGVSLGSIMRLIGAQFLLR